MKIHTFCRCVSSIELWGMSGCRTCSGFQTSFCQKTQTPSNATPPGNKDLTRPWLGIIQVQTEQPFSVALCQFARPPASWNVPCWSSWLLGLKQEAIRRRKQWFYPSKLGRKGEAWWNFWTSSRGWENLEAFFFGWLVHVLWLPA